MLKIPLYLLILNIILSKFIPQLSILDEVIIIFVLLYTIVMQVYKVFAQHVIKKSDLYLLFFAVLSFPYFFSVEIVNIILSLIFFLKLHLIIIYLKFVHVSKIKSVLNFLILFTFTGILFQLILPGVHANLLYRELSRGELNVILSGFQANPNYLAFTIGLFFAANNFNLITKSLSGIILLMTGSRTGLVFGIAAFSIMRIGKIKLSRLFLIISIICIIIFYFLFTYGLLEKISNDITYFSGSISDNLYIRAIMIKMSVSIAIEQFPLGVGLGEFGTPYSWASQAYNYYGVSGLHFFTEYSSSVFDSNFASLLGTSGVIGFVFFFVSLYWLIQKDIQNRLLTFMYLTLIFIVSIFMPVFSNGYLALIIGLYFKMLVNRSAE